MCCDTQSTISAERLCLESSANPPAIGLENKTLVGDQNRGQRGKDVREEASDIPARSLRDRNVACPNAFDEATEEVETESALVHDVGEDVVVEDTVVDLQRRERVLKVGLDPQRLYLKQSARRQANPRRKPYRSLGEIVCGQPELGGDEKLHFRLLGSLGEIVLSLTERLSVECRDHNLYTFQCLGKGFDVLVVNPL